MSMRIRTVYFCVPADRFEEVVGFWGRVLGVAPAHRSDAWCEFKVGEINLGLLPVIDNVAASESCVPVLEFPDDEIDAAIVRSKRQGAVAFIEGRGHPDFPRTAAVMRDPWGYRFEMTNFHG
jgi:predicted enzyme related to lactoylglutathione lyase